MISRRLACAQRNSQAYLDQADALRHRLNNLAVDASSSELSVAEHHEPSHTSEVSERRPPSLSTCRALHPTSVQPSEIVGTRLPPSSTGAGLSRGSTSLHNLDTGESNTTVELTTPRTPSPKPASAQSPWPDRMTLDDTVANVQGRAEVQWRHFLLGNTQQSSTQSVPFSVSQSSRNQEAQLSYRRTSVSAKRPHRNLQGGRNGSPVSVTPHRNLRPIPQRDSEVCRS